MKKLFIFLFAAAALNMAAQSEITLKSQVMQATVFIKGAQVVRSASANIPIGKSTLKFANLSPYIDAKSVQVKIDADVMVISVNHQLNYNDTIKNTEEINNLRNQIAALNDKITLEKTNKEIINDELNFLKDNQKIGGNNNGIDFNNLKLTTAYYSERVSALKIKSLSIDKTIKNLNDEKNKLEKQISVLGTKTTEPTGEVILVISSKSAIKIPVELSYYVENASWFPTYDIRAKNVAEPIELSYKANIIQNTKEDWKNIKLKVSSNNPNLSGVAPKLKTYFLNYNTKPPKYDFNSNQSSNQASGVIVDAQTQEPLISATILVKGTTVGTITDIDGKFSLTIPQNSKDLEISYIGYNSQTIPIRNGFTKIELVSNMKELDEVVAVGYGIGTASGKGYAGAAQTVRAENIRYKQSPVPTIQVENTTSIEFEIETPYTILSENKSTIVEMERYSLPANYEYYCVPKIDKDAFLLAYISDWAQYNLLEGEANIFFENTFIGKTILDVRYLSDTLNISLGRDKSVMVQREKVKEFSTKKLLSNKGETTRDWKIIVRNNKRQPISMILFDQIPVSINDEISVTTEKLSNGELNKETGEVKWKLTLQPSEKSEIELLYKVKYPKNRNLTIE